MKDFTKGFLTACGIVGVLMVADDIHDSRERNAARQAVKARGCDFMGRHEQLTDTAFMVCGTTITVLRYK